jgi:hypothetical protein
MNCTHILYRGRYLVSSTYNRGVILLFSKGEKCNCLTSKERVLKPWGWVLIPKTTHFSGVITYTKHQQMVFFFFFFQYFFLQKRWGQFDGKLSLDIIRPSNIIEFLLVLYKWDWNYAYYTNSLSVRSMSSLRNRSRTKNYSPFATHDLCM